MSRKIIVQRKDEEPIQVSLTSNSGFILLEQETVSTIHTPVEWDDITAAVATLRAEQTGTADALDPPATHPPIWEEIRAICDDIDLRDLQERIAALEAALLVRGGTDHVASRELEREAVLPEGWRVHQENSGRLSGWQVSVSDDLTDGMAVADLCRACLAIEHATTEQEARQLLIAHLAQRAGAEAAR